MLCASAHLQTETDSRSADESQLRTKQLSSTSVRLVDISVWRKANARTRIMCDNELRRNTTASKSEKK